MSPRLGIVAESPGEHSAARKEPLVAGLLSWILPGVGSFYAGNSGHGVRHLLISAGAVTAVVVGASAFDDNDEDATLSGVLIVGGLTLAVTNAVWGIITAVNDAHAANRVAGVARYLDPGLVRLVPSTSLVAGFDVAPRMGVRLVEFGF